MSKDHGLAGMCYLHNNFSKIALVGPFAAVCNINGLEVCLTEIVSEIFTFVKHRLLMESASPCNLFAIACSCIF